MQIRYRFMLVLQILLCSGRCSAQLQHVDNVTSPDTWQYTVFNDENIGSSEYIGFFDLTLAAPITVSGTPNGWDFQTDNSSYVLWFNTDVSLPYPNDIAPGSSLGGFEVESQASDASLQDYTVTYWDHTADAPGPGASGSVLSPSLPPPSVPEPNCFVTLVAGFGFMLWRLLYNRRVVTAKEHTSSSRIIR